MSNEHLKEFLIDDIKSIEKNFNIIREKLIDYQLDKDIRNEIEELDMKLNYWSYHSKNL